MAGEIHKLAGRYKAYRYWTTRADVWADHHNEAQKESEHSKEDQWNCAANDGLSDYSIEVNYILCIGRIGEESYWSY